MDRLNVLVCDDDTAIVDALAIYLQQEDYGVIKAYTGRQALKVLSEQKIHLVLLDIMMPELDGLLTTIKIREELNVPIIILSAKSEDTDKITGHRRVYDVVEFHVKLKSEASIKASDEAEEVVENNLKRYYSIKKMLPNQVNFAYYLENGQTGETVTNIKAEEPVALIKKQPTVVNYNQWATSDYSYPMNEDVRHLLTGTPYEVYAAVIEPLKPGDVFYDDFMNFGNIIAWLTGVTILLVASIILIVYLLFTWLLLPDVKNREGR